MIEIVNLTKRYGNKNAVNDITFTVNEGEILGFLGPNGAGKSTTMNILTGYLSASDGTVKIEGIDVLENPIEAKKKIGYLPEHPPLYMDMTVSEYLNFVFELKNCKLEKDAHIDDICGLVKIKDMRKRLIKNLSKGYQQRVGLAQALIGNPQVLILDEPTVGLDPMQIIEIRNLIKKLGSAHTIILSSHILSEVQSICNRVVVINKGEIVADGSPEDLTHLNTAEYKHIVRVCGLEHEVLKAIRELEGVKKAEFIGEKEKETVDISIEAQTGVDIRRPLFKLLAEKNWPIFALKGNELSLEDVFINLVESKKDENLDATKLKKKKKKIKNEIEKIVESEQEEEN